jgi:hypothetical protein
MAHNAEMQTHMSGLEVSHVCTATIIIISDNRVVQDEVRRNRSTISGLKDAVSQAESDGKLKAIELESARKKYVLLRRLVCSVLFIFAYNIDRGTRKTHRRPFSDRCKKQTRRRTISRIR